MTLSSNKTKLMVRSLILVTLLLSGWLGYTIYTNIQLLKTTGRVEVTSSDTGSIISISGVHTQAMIIGSGAANIRIKPGTYQLVAKHSGQTAASIITVNLHQTIQTKLVLGQAPHLASPYTVTFNGIDTLIDKGLSTTQVTNLKQLFFNYKKTVKTVSIETDTIGHTPYDLSGNNPNFTLTFVCKIDGQIDKCAVTYADLVNVQLVIQDSITGAQLFNAGSEHSAADS